MRLRLRRPLFSVALLGPATACAFTVFKVDPNCVALGAFDKIQEAVDEAAATPGADYVWISNGHQTTTYANEQITINDPDGVIIEGGFADCFDNDPGSDTTAISGSTVFSISGNSQVFFSNLVVNGTSSGFDIKGNNQVYFGSTIIRGSASSGIRFLGQGSVTLGAGTEVSSNAGSTYGGGIYFAALNGDATLNLLDDARIHDNSATFGGGIYLEGNGDTVRLMALSPNVQIDHNKGGYGGGIDIEGGRADLSARVHDNMSFTNGGGIWVHPEAVLRAFPRDASHPPAIVGNSADANGGGIYVEGDACLFNPQIYGNTALKGAALYEAPGFQRTSGVYINGGFPARLGVECGPETVAALGGEAQLCSSSSCSLIRDNVAATPGYATGPVIYLAGELVASRLRIQNNVGSYLLEGHGASTNLHTCLVTTNSVLALLHADGGSGNTFSSCTLANDTLPGGAHVMEFLNGASGTLSDDIIAEPGHLSVQSSGPLLASYVLSNDISTLPASASVVAGDPLFVASNDYHLTYKSPAVDFAPAIGGSDLDGAPRDVDLSQAINRFGPADLGAYETQSAFTCDPSNDAVFCNGFERP